MHVCVHACMYYIVRKLNIIEFSYTDNSCDVNCVINYIAHMCLVLVWPGLKADQWTHTITTIQ